MQNYQCLYINNNKNSNDSSNNCLDKVTIVFNLIINTSTNYIKTIGHLMFLSKLELFLKAKVYIELIIDINSGSLLFEQIIQNIMKNAIIKTHVDDSVKNKQFAI